MLDAVKVRSILPNAESIDQRGALAPPSFTPSCASQHDRPIIFCDANTIWHRRLAEALGELTEAIAFEPKGSLFPRRKNTFGTSTGTRFVQLNLVRGWASTLAAVGQRQFASVVFEVARQSSRRPIVFLTSPAYRVLARLLSEHFRLVYYCADDYREYEGWGGNRIIEAEAEIISRSVLSIFVSEALRERAVVEYGIPREQTLVSSNATERRFLHTTAPVERPAELNSLAQPIVGVLGSVSDRLNLDLLRKVADLDALGTLLIAGPIEERTLERATWLKRHSKVHVTGRLPHSEMHLYARAMDAALIPYEKTRLNYYCSPMRFYDHLATGVPIFATDACDQVTRAEIPGVYTAPADDLPAVITTYRNTFIGGTHKARRLTSRSMFWSERAEVLLTAVDTL